MIGVPPALALQLFPITLAEMLSLAIADFASAERRCFLDPSRDLSSVSAFRKNQNVKRVPQITDDCLFFSRLFPNVPLLIGIPSAW